VFGCAARIVRGASPCEDAVGGPFNAAGLPYMKGQAATCAGLRDKTFTLEAREVTVDLGMGLKFALIGC
jgi:hypothetical protein